MSKKFLTNVELEAGLVDGSNSAGTSGYVLSSTGTATSWIDPATIAVAESEQVHIACKNTSGVAISKGDPVYITGTVGTSFIVQIAKADASNSAKMPAVGLAESDLAINAEGYVIVSGVLKNITTDPLSTGDGTPSSNDTVYVKAGGGLTRTKPTGASNLIQNVGKVGRVQSTSAGSLAVSTIMRTNDVPNLNTGKIWVGSSTYTTESGVVHLDEGNSRMGINTATPAYALDVDGGIVGAASIFLEQSSPSVNFYDLTFLGSIFMSSGQMGFQTNSSTRMVISSSGNVGIGTTSPGGKLHVKDSSTSPGIIIESDGGNEQFVIKRYSNTNEQLILGFHSSDYGTIQAVEQGVAYRNLALNALGGSVGIGTTSPDTILEVVDENPILTVRDTSTGLSSANAALRLAESGSGDTLDNYWDLKMKPESVGGTTNFAIANSSLGEVLNINYQGNVGIGTASPSAKLHISSGTANEDCVVIIESDTDNNDENSNPRILFKQDGGAVIGRLGYMDNTNSLEFINQYAETLRLGTSNSTHIIIREDGDVGIGTTSPAQKLDVSGNIKMTETAATTDTDKFIVSDSGVLKYRTGSEVLSDIGAAASSHNHDSTYLGITAKAADSNLLDGIDSGSFLRSDADDTTTGKITFAKGSSGVLASRTGFNDFLGYNPSYGSYIGGGPGNASGRYLYAGGYINNGTSVYTLWHAGNDGSGSGLDADLLDGKQPPTNFAATSQTYTTIASGGWALPTGSSIFSKSDSVGGVSDDGYWFVTGRRDVGGGYSGIYTSHSDGNAWIGYSLTNSANPTWYKLWTSGNDGSNSGLDADLLDGQHGSYYLDYNNFTNTPTIPSAYTHPTHPGDDINLDTGALTGATVISDLDFNVTTDTLGHVTDANATYSTRNLTASDVGALAEGETTVVRRRGTITSQDWNTYIDGTEAGWYQVSNASGSNRPSAYTYGTQLNFSTASANKLQIYAPHNATDGNGVWIRTGWNTDYDAWREIPLYGMAPYSGGDLRASTFYDSNNTGYYANPASTSIFNVLTTTKLKTKGLFDWDVYRIVNPDGATYFTGTSSVTGGLLIQLPTARRNSNTMMQMTINVYQYNTGRSFQLRVGGYNYSTGQWYNVFAYLIGDQNFPQPLNVRFGDDGNRNWIMIGETNSSWSYPQFQVTDWQAGYSGVSEDWSEGWATSVVTSIPSGHNETRVASSALTSNNASNWSTDLYAPIYYDSNNTGYYVNPEGSSQLADIYYNAWLRNNRTASSSGLYWETGTPGAGWHIYPADTNDMNMRAGTANGSLRFTIANETARGYVHWTTSNEVGFLNSSRGWSLRVDNSGNTFATASHRAPVFYDSNNTAYYVNPASTSVLGGINMNGTLNMQNFNISNVNHITINDPGAGEGIQWNGGNGWQIYESPDNMTNASGNLQFTTGTTFRFRVDTSGNTFSSSSSRAPIFYDSNDTGYYVDPASTGTAARLSGDVYLNEGKDFGIVTSFGNAYLTNFYGALATNTSLYIGGGTSTTGDMYCGPARATIYYDRTSTTYYMDCADAGDSIRVAGDIVAYYASDKRLKDNIKPIENALDKINAINGVTFEWNEESHKTTGRKDIGVVAQEVEEVLPEIVETRSSGYKAVDYQKLTAVLIEAVKEQQKQIDELKSMINGSSK